MSPTSFLHSNIPNNSNSTNEHDNTHSANDEVLKRLNNDRNERHNVTYTVRKGTDNTQLQNSNNDQQKETEGGTILWHNILKFSILHIFMIYGLYLILTAKVSWKTTVYAYLSYMIGGFGITAGAHRLWSHRSYKANLPLRIFLMLCNTSMFENNIYHWCREHRTHHKYTDTDKDPHNAKRGVFYSHIGWLMYKKTKEVVNAGRTIDFSDILGDPVVQFQIKYYYPMVLLLTFAMPTLIPWYFWNENMWNSFVVCVARFVWGLNSTFLVNSFAHAFGNKPYEKDIKPTENALVSILAFGEGWHNYHHIFPWDYKAAELGNYGLNFTTCFLDLMAKIGWATELKVASKEIVQKRILRTGDGSHRNVIEIAKEDSRRVNHKKDATTENIWGWGDHDMNEDEKKDIINYNSLGSR